MTETGVRIQIYSAITAYCMVAIVEHDLKLHRSTNEVLRISSASLLDKTPIKDLFTKKTEYVAVDALLTLNYIKRILMILYIYKISLLKFLLFILLKNICTIIAASIDDADSILLGFLCPYFGGSSNVRQTFSYIGLPISRFMMYFRNL